MDTIQIQQGEILEIDGEKFTLEGKELKPVSEFGYLLTDNLTESEWQVESYPENGYFTQKLTLQIFSPTKHLDQRYHEAIVAYVELKARYKAWLEDEVIDWIDMKHKYFPYVNSFGKLLMNEGVLLPNQFAFTNHKKCQAFIEAHEQLLKQASPLLWGFEIKEDK